MPDVELSFYRRVAPSDPLSQGDIFANVRCVEPANPPSEKLRTVVVLSHGCEIDKQDSTSCYTAAVRLFKRERDDIREAIRSGRTANTIYLPRNDALNGEGLLIFAYSIGCAMRTSTQNRFRRRSVWSVQARRGWWALTNKVY